jgi:hypothetical protein
MATVISTSAVTKTYILWKRDDEQHIKIKLWDCTIPGGAGVVNKHSLRTPEGVATEIDDSAIEKLMQIPAFVNDVKNGFMKVLKGVKARTVDADEEALKDMNTDGTGRQITSEDLEKDGAVINDDGSVDVSKGGKNAVARKNIEKEATDSITIDTPEKPKRGRGRGSKKKD